MAATSQKKKHIGAKKNNLGFPRKLKKLSDEAKNSALWMEYEVFEKRIKIILELDAEIDTIRKILHEKYTDQLCKILDKLVNSLDDDTNISEWVAWWIWENEKGNGHLFAGYDGNLKQIKTIKQLHNLIYG